MEMISIEEELAKNPKLKQQDIDHLKEWIHKEKCAPSVISDVQLALFLSCCDYCIETTKETIKTNYTWRAEQPEYFTKRNPSLDSRLAITLNVMNYTVLPNRTSQDEIVMFTRIENNDSKNFHCLETIKLFFMYMDMYLLRHGTSNGIIFFYDCESVTFSIARKVNLQSIKALFFFIQDAVSFKLSAIHFMNSHPAFELLFALFKPFIRGPLINKIHFHKVGSSTIFAHVAPASVPKVYNGEEDSPITNLHEKSKEILQSFQPWFDQEERALADMALRLDSKKGEEDVTNTSYSFKKLELE